MKSELIKAAFMMGYLEKEAKNGFDLGKVTGGYTSWPEGLTKTGPLWKEYQSKKQQPGLWQQARGYASGAWDLLTSPKETISGAAKSAVKSNIAQPLTEELSNYIKNQLPKDLEPSLKKLTDPKTGELSKFVGRIGSKAFPYALGMIAGPPIIQTLLSQLFPSRGPAVNAPPRMISPPYGMMQQGYTPVASRFKAPKGYY